MGGTIDALEHGTRNPLSLCCEDLCRLIVGFSLAERKLMLTPDRFLKLNSKAS